MRFLTFNKKEKNTSDRGRRERKTVEVHMDHGRTKGDHAKYDECIPDTMILSIFYFQFTRECVQTKAILGCGNQNPIGYGTRKKLHVNDFQTIVFIQTKAKVGPLDNFSCFTVLKK